MLYIVLLGGKHPKARIEVHDIACAVGDDLQAIYPQLRADWFGGQKGLHIDAWMAVDGIEQWKVEFSPLAPAAGSPRLYVINLGGYEPRAFGEAHHYVLVVAQAPREAKNKARRQCLEHWRQSHTDAVLDVDDCVPIDQVSGRYVHLIERPHQGIEQRNEYIILP